MQSTYMWMWVHQNFHNVKVREEEKKFWVLSLKMAQRAHGHMQPILFLLTDTEIVLNKIWVFLGSIGRV